MNYRLIAKRIQQRGYEPKRGAATSESQFVRSVWLALTRDARIAKVGPGTFDLESRSRTT